MSSCTVTEDTSDDLRCSARLRLSFLCQYGLIILQYGDGRRASVVAPCWLLVYICPVGGRSAFFRFFSSVQRLGLWRIILNHLDITKVVCAYHRPARVSPLWFNFLQRWTFLDSVTDAYTTKHARWCSSMFPLTSGARCVSLVSLPHRSLSKTLPSGTWCLLSITTFATSLTFRSWPALPLFLSGGAEASRSTDIVIETALSSMVSKKSEILTERNGPSALGITFRYRSLSVVFKFFFFTASVDLSTCTEFFVWKPVFCTRVYRNHTYIASARLWIDSPHFLFKASPVERGLRSMLGDTLAD